MNWFSVKSGEYTYILKKKNGMTDWQLSGNTRHMHENM